MYQYTLPGSLGWTGTFILPGETSRRSNRPCNSGVGPDAVNICGRPEEFGYLQRIGCQPSIEDGQTACTTDYGHAGSVFCCSRARLHEEQAQAEEEGVSTAAVLGGRAASLVFGGLALSVGFVLVYRWWQEKKEEEEFMEASKMLFEVDRPYREKIRRS